MRCDPVARDVDAAGNPDAVVPGGVVEETLKRGGTTWAARQTAMQPDRHHPRPIGAFSVQNVETVLQVRKELVARVEALRGRKAHVVGVERVWNNKKRLAGRGVPVREVIGVTVSVVEKPAFFGNEAARLWTDPALIPAERP